MTWWKRLLTEACYWAITIVFWLGLFLLLVVLLQAGPDFEKEQTDES